jgi:thiamine-phosphate pyrophosphorylase
MPPSAARELLGPDAIVGYSTHSVGQALSAAKMPIDYLALGPIFATNTKETSDPIVGLEGISSAKAVIGDMPLVGIGGINRTNVRSVIEAGAASAACITAVLHGVGPQISDSMHDIQSFATPPVFNTVQK